MRGQGAVVPETVTAEGVAHRRGHSCSKNTISITTGEESTGPFRFTYEPKVSFKNRKGN